MKTLFFQVLCVCKKPKPTTATIITTSIDEKGKIRKTEGEAYPYCGKCGNIISAQQMRKHNFYKQPLNERSGE